MDSDDKLGSFTKNLFSRKNSENENAHPEIRDFPGEANLPSNLNERMGDCIILNYEEYEEHMKLKPRYESKHDADSLEHVFKELKFDVHRRLSLNRSRTLKTLKEISSNLSENSKYFVCCILTHGDSTDGLATRDNWLDLDDFLQYFYPTRGKLIGKPKIFIIQACRGGATEKAIKLESADLATGPNELFSDFIIAYSTYPGKLSFKNPKSGTFYIQELCNCLEHFSKDQNFLQILTVVNYHIACFFESCSKEPALNESRQMPNFSSTLKSPISFEKCIKPWKSNARKIHTERRASLRLDKTGEKDPYCDLKSYAIATAQNVYFFQILTKAKDFKELREASADLSVYITEMYKHERPKCDMKKSEILNAVGSIACTDYKDAIDCMIGFIASPGKRDYLCDKDGRKISKQQIIEQFVQNQHSSLVGKPKIFIFLTCESVQVESTDKGGSTERPDSYSIAEHADLLSIFISIKNKKDLIGPLKEIGCQLKNCRSENLLSILTKINSILIEKYKFQTENPRNTFTFNSTLTKNVFLP